MKRIYLAETLAPMGLYSIKDHAPTPEGCEDQPGCTLVDVVIDAEGNCTCVWFCPDPIPHWLLVPCTPCP